MASALLLAAVGCSSDSEGGDGDPSTTADETTTDETSEPGSEVDADVVLSTEGDVIAIVDDRFQSYNVEMVEVTGGEFWKPYDAGSGRVERPPLDLSDERIRNLADALGPAYVRVSGSWANNTYFDPDGSAGDTPPDGFIGLLTGDQWKGVGEFAEAIDGKVVVSFAANDAVRDADGVWQPDQARALLEFTVEHDIPLVAVEFLNEPGLPVNVPADYDAARYQEDFEAFVELVEEVMPDLVIVGASATADMESLVIAPAIGVDDLMEASGSALDVFSYHYYPNVSERCGSTETSETVLTDEYLERASRARDFYAEVRDRYTPDAPMWVTEIAQAACGGDRWAAWFQDSIRYIDTLGRLARGDGDAVFHNTLAASDYALIDEANLEPRASYWAGVLWGRLVGPEVLEVEASDDLDGLTTYAYCTPSDDGSTIHVVVNASTTETRTVATESGSVTSYQLTGESLDAPGAMLNGSTLEAAEDGTLPDLDGEDIDGAVTIPPASVTYLVDQAPNEACA